MALRPSSYPCLPPKPQAFRNPEGYSGGPDALCRVRRAQNAFAFSCTSGCFSCREHTGFPAGLRHYPVRSIHFIVSETEPRGPQGLARGCACVCACVCTRYTLYERVHVARIQSSWVSSPTPNYFFAKFTDNLSPFLSLSLDIRPITTPFIFADPGVGPVRSGDWGQSVQ